MPRGVQVDEPGGVGVSAVDLMDAAGNRAGATGIGMTNFYPFGGPRSVKVTLHCELPVTALQKPALDARANTPYNFAYNFGEGITTQEAQITDGTLPPGLTLDARTGTITGTPTTLGTYSYQIYWKSADRSGLHRDTITVSEPAHSPAAEIPTGAGITIAPNSAAATGDVLGLGYEQVIQINGSNVEIREPQNRGGNVIRSFPALVRSELGWDRWGFATSLGSLGGMSLPTARLTVDGGSVYVAGVVLDKETCPEVLPCSEAPKMRVFRYGGDGALLGSREFAFPNQVTSLSAQSVHGRTYLAVGLTRGGVRILDGKTLEDRTQLHTDWSRYDLVVDMDVATMVGLGVLPGDGGGQLVSVAGRWTHDAWSVVASDALTGAQLWTYNWHATLQDRVVPDLVSFGEYGPNGEVAVAIGWWKQNKVDILDAKTGAKLSSVAGDSKVTGLRFFTDVDGQKMLAIQRDGISEIGSIDAGGGWKSVTEIDTGSTSSAVTLAKYFVPGYRAGTVKVANSAAGDVSVKFYSSRNRDNGCWVGSVFPGATPWPSLPFKVAPATESAPYGTATLTGAGDCAAERGVFFAEVTDTTGNARQIVKIGTDINEPWKLSVLETAGDNQYAVALTPNDRAGSVLGDWKLTVTDQFTAPTAITAPTVTGARLTPAMADGYKPTANVDDPSRPVYRFTVTGAQWDIPNAAQRAGATLPAMIVEGSPDGTNWTTLGTLNPQTNPDRDGNKITLGTSSFDWQTTYGATDYTHFRVHSGTTTSNTINTTQLTPPPPAPGVVNKLILGTAGNSLNVAVRPNGLDQVPFTYSLLGSSNGQGLDAMDPNYAPLYDRVYFRDTNSRLITGLGSATDPGRMVSVTHERGQYSNDGIALQAASQGAFLSSTDITDRAVKAVFKATGADFSTATSGIISVSPNKLAYEPGGFGTEGLYIQTQAEGLLELQSVTETRPALFNMGETAIGLQLNATAITGSGAFPLGSAGKNAAAQPIVTDGLRITGGRAYLGDPARFGFIGMFTTDLITHGDRVPIVNAYVKNKEKDNG
ncbi:putative Ig domain-containing protein [Microbacterium rhizomatis]|uniref:putative Ig domain-containing protein n=1 Tax=Microbacterium rhizomatis TaxID=1631477 RepID=UPI001B86AE71|nr:putative Ig domain-containing protein [Microbacterium rhizomatis]